MRIISGEFGGQKIIAPGGDKVRPTSDKIRGAIFNSLRSKIDIAGAHVMDVFSGSGALGLEAISNGAAFCTFIDINRESIGAAKQNAVNLNALSRCRFIMTDAVKIKPRGDDLKPADIVFMDPPYKKDLICPALMALHGGGWVKPGGVCVLEAEKTFDTGEIENFNIMDEKTYGDTRVVFLIPTISNPGHKKTETLQTDANENGRDNPK
jgi:16S rRNA (guanine966-N2)-methyltransferase